MRAVRYDAFGGPLRVEEVADPQPPVHGAVLRVEAAGLCRSDWHGWMGHDPDIAAFPHVPGHELAGVVEAVGAEVERWRGGERVTVPFVCACGSCAQCGAGEQQVCARQQQPGFHIPGAFAERVAIPWADVNLVALPDDVGFAAAASLGCRFATAFRAVRHVGRVRAGEWVVVHGCGGVGLSAVMIAAAAGARVVAVDVDPEPLERARNAGAEDVLPAGTDVREVVPDGVHLSVDAIGSETAAAAGIAALRPRGRHVQVGLLPDPPRLPMHLVIARELEVLGAHGMPAHAYPEMLAEVAAGRLDPASLVAREIGLEEVPDALPHMADEPARGVTLVRPGLR